MDIPNLKRSKNDPLIPIDYEDPTELGKIRAGALRKLGARLNSINDNVKKYIRENVKPTSSKTNAVAHNETIFDYIFGDEEYEDFTEFMNALLYSSLLSSSLALLQYSTATRATFIAEWKPDWWFNEYISKSNEKGAQGILTSAKYQTTSSTVGKSLTDDLKNISIDDFKNSIKYKSDEKMQQRAAYAEFKTLSDSINSTMAEVLRQGIRDGVSQNELVNRVTAFLEDSDEKGKGSLRRKAEFIVRNRLNNDRRESGRDHINQLNDEVYGDTDYEMRQLWFSALMPQRTREWHGVRHGEIHTTEQDETFYSEGGNQFNCYCHQTAILVYKGTNDPVVNSDLLEQMAEQKKIYLATK